MLEQPNILFVMQPLAAIKITGAVIHRCFLKKAKSKKVGKKCTKVKCAGCRLLVLE